MDATARKYEPAPEKFRDYLLLLARACVRKEDAAILSPADVVQETLLEAHRKRDQFRGASDAELAAWLRQMLFFCVADACRAQFQAKRDVARERSLERAIEESSARLDAWLAADQSSPSEKASREEDLLRLAGALGNLPDDQRRAVELKHLQNLSVAEIARELERSETAVGGLLRRGMARLRELMTHEQAERRDVST